MKYIDHTAFVILIINIFYVNCKKYKEELCNRFGRYGDSEKIDRKERTKIFAVPSGSCLFVLGIVFSAFQLVCLFLSLFISLRYRSRQHL